MLCIVSYLIIMITIDDVRGSNFLNHEKSWVRILSTSDIFRRLRSYRELTTLKFSSACVRYAMGNLGRKTAIEGRKY